MTTALQTITTGLEALRVLGFGQQPTTAQAQYCLKQLRGFIVELAGFGGSLPLAPIAAAGDYTVCTRWPAVRVQCTDGVTVTLPQLTDQAMLPDGMRVHVIDAANNAASDNVVVAANGALIKSFANGAAAPASSYTISTDGGAVMLMWRADLGLWAIIPDEIGLNDALPWPADFDVPIALNAAMSYARFGQSLSQADQRRADKGMRRLRGRYAKPPRAQHDPAVSAIGNPNRAGAGFTLSDFLNGLD
jgi:hypothetical protein